KRRVLRRDGQIVPKEGGSAEPGDILIADLTVRDGDNTIGSVKEATLDVERQLAFKDGLVRNFAEAVKGAKAGDTRIVDVELSSAAAGNLGGKTVKATLEIK